MKYYNYYIVFFIFLFSDVSCQNRIFNWLDAGQQMLKGKVNTGARVLNDGLTLGNEAVRTSALMASSIVNKGTHLGKYALNSGTLLGSKAVTGGTKLANDAIDIVDTVAGRVPVMSSILGIGRVGVNSISSIGQGTLSAVDTVGTAKLELANTATKVGAHVVSGLATAVTVGGQTGIALGAAVTNTLIENIFRKAAKGLSYITDASSVNNTDLTSPIHSGLGLLLNQNTYDSLSTLTPNLVHTVTDYFNHV